MKISEFFNKLKDKNLYLKYLEEEEKQKEKYEKSSDIQPMLDSGGLNESE